MGRRPYTADDVVAIVKMIAPMERFELFAFVADLAKQLHEAQNLPGMTPGRGEGLTPKGDDDPDPYVSESEGVRVPGGVPARPEDGGP